MNTVLVKLALSAAATPFIVLGFHLAGVEIAWWVALIIALALVFTGDWIASADGDVL